MIPCGPVGVCAAEAWCVAVWGREPCARGCLAVRRLAAAGLSAVVADRGVRCARGAPVSAGGRRRDDALR